MPTHPAACQNGVAILAGIMEAFTERIADILERVGSDLDGISGSIFARSGSEYADQPRLACDDRAHRFQRRAELESTRKPGEPRPPADVRTADERNVDMSNEQRNRFRSISRDVISLSDHASFLGTKMSFLLEATLGLISVEQNNIIKIFSVAAVMFMPPTLIASIYGMNFHLLPDLPGTYGNFFFLDRADDGLDGPHVRRLQAQGMAVSDTLLLHRVSSSMPHPITSMALFCDFENIALGVRDAKYAKFDIDRVLERLLLKGSIVVKKAYCDWDRYKEFKAPMHEASFELIEIPHVRMSGKNSADIRLVVDALDLCYTKSHVDTFVIISGDSDFSPLVSKLRENNKAVIGVGVKSSTSDLLIANCDEFIYYDDLVRQERRRRQQRTRRRPPAKQRDRRDAPKERRQAGRRPKDRRSRPSISCSIRSRRWRRSAIRTRKSGARWSSRR